MAAGPFITPYLAKLNQTNGTQVLSGTAANYRAILIASTWTPNLATDELYADVSAHELATANGYVVGGGALANVTLTQTLGITKFTCDPFVWTAAGGSIAAFRYFGVRYNGTLNGKVNPLVVYCLGDAAGIDVPLTTVGNTITFTPNATGIVSY